MANTLIPERINFLNISAISLAKLIRTEIKTYNGRDPDLMTCLTLARLMKEAHRQGEIRGRALK